MNHGSSFHTRMLNGLKSEWTTPASASPSTPATVAERNSAGDASVVCCSMGAGPRGDPRYCIENMFSTRRPGSGTRAPPCHA